MKKRVIYGLLVLALAAALAVVQAQEEEPAPDPTVEAAVEELFAATAAAEATHAAARTAQAEEALPMTATVQAAFDRAVQATAEAQVREMTYGSTALNPPSDTLDLSLTHHTEDGDPAIGPEDAAVTIVEYSDFSCGYCGRFYTETLGDLLEAFEGDVRFVYRDFPVLGAWLPAVAAECADEQGAFWEYHNYLFANQRSLDETHLMAIAYQLDLDMGAFEACLADEAIVEEVQADAESGQALGFSGTPSFTVNDELVAGAQPFATFYDKIEVELSKVRGDFVPTATPEGPVPVFISLEELPQWEAPPEMMLDPEADYYATLVTAKGDIVVDLLEDEAPMTVNNFVFLAREGFYDNTSFHRVIEGFVAQGGDPSGTGMGSPGYAFPDETDNEMVFDEAGLMAMANAGPNTNGSQFFITYAPLPDLDGSYTVFGRVVEGMDVAESLTPRDPQTMPGIWGDALATVEIEAR